MTFIIILLGLIGISFGMWQDSLSAGCFMTTMLYFIGILVEIHKK